MVFRLRIGTGEHVGENHRLLPERCHQTVDLTAVLRTFAHRIDECLILTTHLIVDDDPAFHHQPRTAGDLDVGPDAGGHDDHVGGQAPAVGESHSGDAAVVGAQHRGGPLTGVHPHPEFLDLVAQHLPAALVELLVHQVSGRMHHIDVHTLRLQPVGGFEPEQTAADHHRLDVVAGQCHLQHPVGVLDGPKPEDAAGKSAVGLAQTVHVGEEGVRPGRDDQHVESDDAAAGTADGLGESVDGLRSVTGVQGDTVLGVPGHRVQHEIVVVGGGFTGQDVAEHDAVVVAVWLVADHRDEELITTTAGEDLLDGARAGHPVADHDETTFGCGIRVIHRRLRIAHQKVTIPKSTTTSPAVPSGAAISSSSTLSGSTSSTTRNGTLTDDLAPIGKIRIGEPSRVSVT